MEPKVLEHLINGKKYVSRDNGVTWSEINLFEHNVDGKIYVSSDGVNWERKRSPTEATVVKIVEGVSGWILHGSKDKGEDTPTERKRSKKARTATKSRQDFGSKLERMNDDPFDDDRWGSNPFER